MTTIWMIYGAAGYTGRLIAEQARREGLAPLLAGRAEAVTALADALGLTARRFSLDDPSALRSAMSGVSVLVNAAGPFSATSASLRAACRDVGCHYLDITGEIPVFEAAHAEDDAARRAGVVVCPGVGFDVIPTDCVAATLKSALPDAVSLALGFETDSGASQGTLKTAIEALGEGGRVRKGGELRRVPIGYGRRRIDFGRGEKPAVCVPWGDVATAYFSTGIPDIEVFLPMPSAVAVMLRALDPLRPLLQSRPAQTWLKGQVARRVTGPDEAARARAGSHVWGEARNRGGQRRVARLKTANGYTVTVHGALMAVRHLMGYSGPGGYFTPTQLMGERCVEALPGSSRITLEN